MKAKIKWYREILELEPSSRVFFPLGKLLAQYGEYQEAAKTLRTGLSHHPDHLEAQMLLLEILHGLGKTKEVSEIARCLADRFVSHPAFWRVWAEAMNYSAVPGDFPMSLRLLSAIFGGKRISWDEVIEKGMAAAFAVDKRSISISTVEEPSDHIHASVSSLSREILSEEEEEAEFLEEEETELLGASDDQYDDGADSEVAEPAGSPSNGAPQAVDEQSLDPSVLESMDEDEELESDSEESISLRTMTMAGLMAEQGDYAGALDIYQELMASVPPEGAGWGKLAGLVESMRFKLAEQAEAGHAASEQKPAASPVDLGKISLNGKIKLKQTLEMLARRLEDRLSST